MVMDILQVRMNKALVKRVDESVKKGAYSSRGEAIRDAVRKTFWDDQVGTIKLKSNKSSVELIREARKKLSEELTDENWERINNS